MVSVSLQPDMPEPCDRSRNDFPGIGGGVFQLDRLLATVRGRLRIVTCAYKNRYAPAVLLFITQFLTCAFGVLTHCLVHCVVVLNFLAK